MEKVKLSFFDTFAYLIPGIFVFLAILAGVNHDIKAVFDLPKLGNNLSSVNMFFGVLISYILGIFCNHFGHYLYLLSKWKWKKRSN